MASDNSRAGTPSAGRALDLVDAACRDKLRSLTKAGGVSQFGDDFASAAGYTVAAIVVVVYIRLDVYNSTTVSTAIRGWARLAYWLVLFTIPFGLAITGQAFVMSKRVAASATLMLTCPGCGTSHEISDVHRKHFSLTCPICYAVIVGSADTYSTARTCDYCGLAFFGGPVGDCPSCRGGGVKTECPHCKAEIPRGAIGCVSCNRWLVAQKLGESNDSISFGPKLARTYIMDIWNLISPRVDDLDDCVNSLPDSRDILPATANSVLSTLNIPRSVLPNLALAAQWLQRPGIPSEPLPPSIAERLAKFDAILTRFLDRDLKHAAPVREAVRTARRAVAG